MTQADGISPTSQELRGVLGRAKIVYAAYELALTRAAVGIEKARMDKEFELLAAITAAHADCVANLADVYTVLGLPYEAVITVTDFEAIP